MRPQFLSKNNVYPLSGGVEFKFASHRCFDLLNDAIKVFSERTDRFSGFKPLSDRPCGDATALYHRPSESNTWVDRYNSLITLYVALRKREKSHRQSQIISFDAIKVYFQDISHANLTVSRHVYDIAKLFDEKIYPVRLKSKVNERMFALEVSL